VRVQVGRERRQTDLAGKGADQAAGHPALAGIPTVVNQSPAASYLPQVAITAVT